MHQDCNNLVLQYVSTKPPTGTVRQKWLPTITNFSSCENYWAVGLITQILSWLSKRWKEKAPTKQLFYILNKNFISKDAPTHLLHWNTSPLHNRKCTEIIVEYFQFNWKESESGWVFSFCFWNKCFNWKLTLFKFLTCFRNTWRDQALKCLNEKKTSTYFSNPRVHTSLKNITCILYLYFFVKRCVNQKHRERDV